MAYGGKKYLAHDSVFMKAQQTGVFMINTILFPIHKPDFKKKLSICLFRKPFEITIAIYHLQ